MVQIDEGRQRLELDSPWRALKWDQSAEFGGSMEAALHQLHGGVKAADVVGIKELPRRPRMLLVAEFKDFDNPGIPPQQQPKVAQQAVSDELMRDIVRKVIDTLSGATFSHDSAGQRCAELDRWRPALGRSTTQMLILVCAEVPQSQALAALTWTKKLQQRLRWLGPNTRVIVTTAARPFVGDGIRYRII